MTTVIQFPEYRRTPLAETVTSEIKALMGRHGVRQTHLAAWLGLDQTAVSARLRGVTEWKVTEIDRVAEGFDVHPAELMGGYATGPRPEPDGGLPVLRACRDSNPKPSDPKVAGAALTGPARLRPVA